MDVSALWLRLSFRNLGQLKTASPMVVISLKVRWSSSYVRTYNNPCMPIDNELGFQSPAMMFALGIRRAFDGDTDEIGESCDRKRDDVMSSQRVASQIHNSQSHQRTNLNLRMNSEMTSNQ